MDLSRSIARTAIGTVFRFSASPMMDDSGNFIGCRESLGDPARALVPHVQDEFGWILDAMLQGMWVGEFHGFGR